MEFIQEPAPNRVHNLSLQEFRKDQYPSEEKPRGGEGGMISWGSQTDFPSSLRYFRLVKCLKHSVRLTLRMRPRAGAGINEGWRISREGVAPWGCSAGKTTTHHQKSQTNIGGPLFDFHRVKSGFPPSSDRDLKNTTRGQVDGHLQAKEKKGSHSNSSALKWGPVLPGTRLYRLQRNIQCMWEGFFFPPKIVDACGESY